MFHYQLSEQVFSVGVLNPGLRVFDVIMTTEYGTSYNAYLVQGTEKTALIETVHKDYLDYLLANIDDVSPEVKIDYLVMNHNEPDHSGAIAELVKRYPGITILASQAGSIYLKNITNCREINIQVVKDGDKIDLGGKTLRFINAPFLHWPDSMFTYLEEDQILFSCDFLGAHYCEPEVLDSRMRKPERYDTAFEGYYSAIFSPFKKYVLNGLEKIKDLEIKYAAPSHGPILTQGVMLEQAKQKYLEWSTPQQSAHKTIPLFHCSAYGNTAAVAEAIAQGISDIIPDAMVPVYDIIEHDMGELAQMMNESDAFLVGSATINKDALPPVNILLSHAEAIGISKRPTAVFGSYGWSGEALPNLRSRLTALKTNLYPEDFKVLFVPSEEDLKKAREFGAAFAQSL